MGYGITPEDREKLMRLKNQNSSDSKPDLEYEPVEGYDHLDVLQAENRYKIEYGDTSIRILGNSVHQINLSNFIEDYLDTQNFDEAHRRNYKSKDTKAKQFLPVFESEVGLTDDLSKLAKELDPEG